MAKIIHTSTGASNSPRELIVTPKIVGVPTDHLCLWTDENGWDTTTYPGYVNRIYNQNVSALVPINFLYPKISTPYYDSRNRPTLLEDALNGYSAVRFRQHPGNWSSRSYFITWPLEISNSSYPPQTGMTQSVLVRPDSSLFESSGYGSSQVLFSCYRDTTFRQLIHPGRRADERWQLRWKTYNTLSTPDYGCGTIESEWHLVTMVSWWGMGVVELYVDGVLRHTWTGVSEDLKITSSGIEVSFLGTNINPISGGWNGDFAHAALWATALTSNEVSRYWEVVKGKYGL